MLLGRTIAPVNPIGFAHLGHFFDPALQLGMPMVTRSCLNFYRNSRHNNVSKKNAPRMIRTVVEDGGRRDSIFPARQAFNILSHLWRLFQLRIRPVVVQFDCHPEQVLLRHEGYGLAADVAGITPR